MIRNLDTYFASVSSILAVHRGESNAITIADLTLRAGLPNRRATEQLLELRFADFPFPLVSSSAGYYVPAKAEEVNHYLNSLQSRAVCIFLRKRAAMRKALRSGFRREGKRFVDPPQARQGELFA